MNKGAELTPLGAETCERLGGRNTNRAKQGPYSQADGERYSRRDVIRQ